MPRPKNPSTQITVRLKQATLQSIEKERGSRDRAVWIKDAINEKLHRDKREEALIASMKSLNDTLRGYRAYQKMLYAAIICLSRLFMICVREPSGEVLRASLAELSAREDAFKKALIEEYDGAPEEAA
jgi:hypothetical protein